MLCIFCLLVRQAESRPAVTERVLSAEGGGGGLALCRLRRCQVEVRIGFLSPKPLFLARGFESAHGEAALNSRKGRTCAVLCVVLSFEGTKDEC